MFLVVWSDKFHSFHSLWLQLRSALFHVLSSTGCLCLEDYWKTSITVISGALVDTQDVHASGAGAACLSMTMCPHCSLNTPQSTPLPHDKHLAVIDALFLLPPLFLFCFIFWPCEAGCI
ncbi:hypothetical protein SODALDRAFT_61148 [Sodiomyces alkalinus F11]|uniref:Uncharacterized protein n=1 Tax=Sodiomyces alkalinus (strain CBS 110278 / VKM F-3762 / F11) TaxID=1314773 RepID=A0A3N2PLA3_SODAK|nr:hypothetical protein SODALDRAFT_61148 [Sodiomyces alkalinus F11]ROT35303.1 hypothetical protein SODALDRAFT_61148 [Sodiomyces alkalinus F11]